MQHIVYVPTCGTPDGPLMDCLPCCSGSYIETYAYLIVEIRDNHVSIEMGTIMYTDAI